MDGMQGMKTVEDVEHFTSCPMIIFQNISTL